MWSNGKVFADRDLSAKKSESRFAGKRQCTSDQLMSTHVFDGLINGSEDRPLVDVEGSAAAVKH